MELNYEEIGQKIRKHRMARGMKQSGQNISHIENAHTKLSLQTLVTLVNVLGVDCNTLLGKNLSGAQKSVAMQELDRLTAQMDSSKLRLCVEFCRVLAKFDP